jgi:integrase
MTWCKRKEISPIINPAEVEEIKETLKRNEVIPQVPETEPRSLTLDQLEKIRSVIKDPVTKNIINLGVNLGLRASEYGQITMNMVLGTEDERRPPLSGGSIPRFEREHFIEVIGKGKKRLIVLTEEMKTLVKKQLILRNLHRVEHKRFFFSVGKLTRGILSSSHVQKICVDIREKCGVFFTPHNLRHTMSVQFQLRGIPQNIVAQRLGHKGGITQRYSRAQIQDRYKLFQEKVGII